MPHITNHSGSNINSLTKTFRRLYQSKREIVSRKRTSWTTGASQGSVVVGGNGIGQQSNQLRYPIGLSFDRSGNLYISDTNNHRIQKFSIDSTSSKFLVNKT